MNKENLNVLLVEDEAIIALDMKGILQKSGYRVCDVVSTGETALKALESKNPDLVLMDIRLAGKMDGLETSRRIRKNSDVPIIFVTAYMDNETRKQAEILKPSGFIGKPINIAALKEELKNLSKIL